MLKLKTLSVVAGASSVVLSMSTATATTFNPSPIFTDETLARWSGLFLRASILNDRDAFNYVYFTSDAADPNVTVISERVPELTPTVALFGIGIATT